MKELGIYIHIPFCKKRCDYCDFISYANKQDFIEEYIRKIKEEIIEEASKLKEYKVTTIYIGGGTPSYIESKHIGNLIKTIKETKIIDNLENIEITIEVNPGTVDKQKLQDYYDVGINRLSIGLQSANNRLLNLIGRIHKYEDFLETYKTAREVGFKNINVDLMIGLPTQTIENIKESLNKIIELEPEHISVYSLILEEGTLLEKKVSNKELELPNEELEREMYWLVKERLEEAGYIHYEISNFAKSKRESKHNFNCWEQKEYIGFGLAAHSYLNNVRYSNTENINEYINNKDYKRKIHEIQNKEEQMKEYMLLRTKKNRRSKNIRV